MTREMRETTTSPATAYARIAEMIAADRCVVLDGGTATELHGAGDRPGDDEGLWGTRALVHSPSRWPRCTAATRRSAATSSRPTPGACPARCARTARGCGRARGRCTGWTWRGAASGWCARRSTPRVATGECAVAFSLNGEVDSPEGAGDDPAAEPPARGGAARPDPGRDALAGRPAIYVTVETSCSRPGCRCGSASAAAGTACAASTASTGAARRATCSAAPRAASRRWAWARC